MRCSLGHPVASHSGSGAKGRPRAREDDESAGPQESSRQVCRGDCRLHVGFPHAETTEATKNGSKQVSSLSIGLGIPYVCSIQLNIPAAVAATIHLSTEARPSAVATLPPAQAPPVHTIASTDFSPCADRAASTFSAAARDDTEQDPLSITTLFEASGLAARSTLIVRAEPLAKRRSIARPRHPAPPTTRIDMRILTRQKFLS